MVWIIRSRSTFLTSSPLTRATTSGSWAGTGLAGAAAGGCPCAPDGAMPLATGDAVEVGECDAFRNVECLAGVPRECARHELRPDRKSRLRAAETDGLVIIQPDPHNGQQLGRKAHEPGISKIVCRAGLSRGIEREAV